MWPYGNMFSKSAPKMAAIMLFSRLRIGRKKALDTRLRYFLFAKKTKNRPNYEISQHQIFQQSQGSVSNVKM